MKRAEGLSAWLLQRLTGVGPFERMCHHVVIVPQEHAQFVLEILEGFEASAADRLSCDDPEDDFDLIEPRTVLREVDEADTVLGVRQERAAREL